MSSPPYHLRPNKAVDRFLLIESMKHLPQFIDINRYTYHGLGGPFLEDFKLIHHYYPQVKLISIEEDREVWKRQKNHLPCKNLKLVNSTLTEYIDTLSDWDGNHIFWLDYTQFSQQCLIDFESLLVRSDLNTVIKITVPADKSQVKKYLPSNEDSPSDISRFRNEIRQKYGNFTPATFEADDFSTSKRFAIFIQNLIMNSANSILPGSADKYFQVLNTSQYTDTTTMLSVIGVICSRDQCRSFLQSSRHWRLSNTDWAAPKIINVPVLSIKERLLLDNCLPVKLHSGKSLAKKLGYQISDTSEDTISLLSNYSEFYRYYPHFARVSL